MKTLYLNFMLLALAAGLPFSSRAQNGQGESLSKYSYPIFVMTNGQQFTGTAFFYRSGDTSYLVSNYHAIKGMSPLKQAITFEADTLYLKYPSKAAPEEWKILPLNVSEEATGTTEIFSMVDRIDLMKLPVQLPPNAGISFINELVDEEYLYSEPEEIVAFGYPTDPGNIPPFYAKQQRLLGRVNPDGFTDYDASLKLNFPAASDSARAILGGTARYYFFIRPYAAQGFSGAPVFGKFRGPANEVIYRFMGVIFAGQPGSQQTWAIKGSVALAYLQQDN